MSVDESPEWAIENAEWLATYERLEREVAEANPHIMSGRQLGAIFSTLDRAGGDVEQLFSQNEIWIDKNRAEHRLDEMPLSYLCAVQKFIENRVQGYRYAVGNVTALSLVLLDASDHVADEVLARPRRGRGPTRSRVARRSAALPPHLRAAR